VVKHKLSSYSKEKGDPRWGAAGAQKKDAETDNLVIGTNWPLLKGNYNPVEDEGTPLPMSFFRQRVRGRWAIFVGAG